MKAPTSNIQPTIEGSNYVGQPMTMPTDKERLTYFTHLFARRKVRAYNQRHKRGKLCWPSLLDYDTMRHRHQFRVKTLRKYYKTFHF